MRRNIVITAIIFIGMILLGVFVFSDSYLRLGESLRDLGNSAAYYFCKLCGIKNDITVTVNGYSDIFSWGTRKTSWAGARASPHSSKSP